MMGASKWYVDPDELDSQSADPSRSLVKYNVSASPNDFNVKTIYDFMESGPIQLPPFQRNYVWDIKRASRLIESLVMGLPIPQVFLYEKTKSQFYVIDGQQRLLTLYYFLNGRFPRASKRAELRNKLEAASILPSQLLQDDEYFDDFRLSLPLESPEQRHPLEGLTFDELSDVHKTHLHLRTIRVVIVKQTSPKGDGAIYEIFNRLNSGGVNLTAQEIRFSLYYSPFLSMLTRINIDERWRRLLGRSEPDMHFRDVEFLLRGVALLASGEHYRPSMARFLNAFAHKGEGFSDARVRYFEQLLQSFLEACSELPAEAFHGQTNKFTVSIFDAVFAAWCGKSFKLKKVRVPPVPAQKLSRLKKNRQFLAVAQSRTTGATNVRERVAIARQVLLGR